MANLTKRCAALVIGVLTLSGIAAPSAWALSSETIKGATTWLSPCGNNWSVGTTIRTTSAAKAQVAVTLDRVGPLGVQMKSRQVSNGNDSAIAKWETAGARQNLGKYSTKGTQFRLVFTCNKAGSGVSTDFSGSIYF